ncbi:MAG TPA: hypothetical protein IAC44_01480 [Candidatus Merdimorpha stercoravium]|uniref:Uncharacterized protein n=1 Tax=Candidatus Merdimorpha stercoravium TaxID=2840863 RepID=A0A9D1KS82_9FLAO|nr:hypothetical protein [Candidatus Merdimorpha stercoravium]
MKTTQSFLPFLFLVLLVGSCKDSSQKEEPAWEQTPVSGVRMAFDRPKVGCVPILSDSGRLFFRLHRSESHTVALYRIQGDSLLFLQEILPKGDGPEDLYIPQMKLLRDTLYALGLFNGENKILKTAWPPSDDSLQVPPVWKSLHWNGYFNLKDGYPLNDSTLLVTGSQNDNQEMFFLFYPAQERLVPAGFEFPDDIPGRSQSKSIIYSGQIEKHPQKDRFVFYTRSFGRYVLVFDCKNGRVENPRALCADLPKYEFTDAPLNNRRIADDSWTGVRAVSVTQEYIYVIYNDYTMGQMRNLTDKADERWHYTDRIYVYDWEGNPVKCYRTNHPISTLAVSPDGRYAYASGVPQEDQETIWRFPLP